MSHEGAPPTPAGQAPARPLAGVKVVDLSRLLPGPLAVHILADLGATVVKVEEPRVGDPVREAPPGRQGQGALAALLLAGIDSVALDLGQPAAREVLLALLADADVLVETFRPGSLARRGLGPAALRMRFPRLIVASLSGFGQDGPSAARSGHDLTYQALAGCLAAAVPSTAPAEPGDGAIRPSKPAAGMPALPVADLVGGWSTATAILAALHRRTVSGDGCWIDASLYDAALAANLTGWVGEVAGPQPVGRRLALSGAFPCYNLYRTADGATLALAALERHFWRRFCVVLGRRDLRRKAYDQDPRVLAEVAAEIARRPRAVWLELASAHDLPLEVVRSAAEALAEPQAIARGVVRHDALGLPRVAFPARFDGERPAAGEIVPALGEHTAEVVERLGLDPGRLTRRRGVGARFSLRRVIARLLLR